MAGERAASVALDLDGRVAVEDSARNSEGRRQCLGNAAQVTCKSIITNAFGEVDLGDAGLRLGLRVVDELVRLEDCFRGGVADARRGLWS